MALARKCDKCGKLYEHHDDILFNDKIVNSVNLIYISEEFSSHTQQHFDLCPECCFDFLIWLREPIQSAEEPG